MNQLPCPGCQQVYPVPPGLPPQTPFNCQRCGYASTLGTLMQALQQHMAQAHGAQQGNLDAPPLPSHAPQAPEGGLAQMPEIKPTGLVAGGLDLADDDGPPQPEQPKPQGGGDFYDDIPEELRQPTELEKIQAKANKKDPRIPTLAAVIGILLIVGVPLFTSEPEIDPQLVRQGLQPKSDMGMKLGIFAGVAVVVIGGAFVLLRMAREDDDDDDEDYEEEDEA